MSIKVVATANGYYGDKLRVPGESFSILDAEDFSAVWMESEDTAVKAHMRKVANATPDDPEDKDAVREVNLRARQAKDWLKRGGHSSEPDAIETRHVNTGGTDGVVGAEVPKRGQRLSAKDRIAAARTLTGREDIDTAKEADAILAAAETGSDNDDRSRDFASDPSNDAPAPDPDPKADGDQDD